MLPARTHLDVADWCDATRALLLAWLQRAQPVPKRPTLDSCITRRLLLGGLRLDLGEVRPGPVESLEAWRNRDAVEQFLPAFDVPSPGPYPHVVAACSPVLSFSAGDAARSYVLPSRPRVVNVHRSRRAMQTE